MQTDKHPLVGVWEVVGFFQRTEDGQELQDRSYDGGYMWVSDTGLLNLSACAARDRRPTMADQDRLGGSIEETAAAYSTYSNYGGRWTVEGDRLAVEVDYSMFPGWIGA